MQFHRPNDPFGIPSHRNKAYSSVFASYQTPSERFPTTLCRDMHWVYPQLREFSSSCRPVDEHFRKFKQRCTTSLFIFFSFLYFSTTNYLISSRFKKFKNKYCKSVSPGCFTSHFLVKERNIATMTFKCFFMQVDLCLTAKSRIAAPIFFQCFIEVPLEYPFPACSQIKISTHGSKNGQKLGALWAQISHAPLHAAEQTFLRHKRPAYLDEVKSFWLYCNWQFNKPNECVFCLSCLLQIYLSFSTV